MEQLLLFVISGGMYMNFFPTIFIGLAGTDIDNVHAMVFEGNALERRYILAPSTFARVADLLHLSPSDHAAACIVDRTNRRHSHVAHA